MSKLSRHAVIRDIVVKHTVSNQDELRLLLARQGHAVTQATLSRDIRELGLVKTADGYAPPAGEPVGGLPSLERLVREFVRGARAAQNLVVVKTSAGSAPPVAAALDAEEWPEVMGTIAGDDTVVIVSPTARDATRLVKRVRELLA